MQTWIDAFHGEFPQVTDILKKEDGKYARFSMITMLLHGYQARVGILTAGHYGPPQASHATLHGFVTMWNKCMCVACKS
jgi:hypothetical protein